jgi:ATP-dependent DNA helicase RecG
MNLEHIKMLCENGEKNIVEYKSSTAHLRAAFETVCAFLNTKGGTVLIGVKDNGRIIGQHISDNTRKEIAREIKRIEPTASIEVNYTEIEDNKAVIAIHVDTW